MEKILIWGTGNIAKHVIENGINGEIIGFIETNKTIEYFYGKKVYSAHEMPQDYEYILVANSFGTEIYNFCVNKNFDLNKIIFLQEIKKREGFTELKKIKSLLGIKNYIDY